MSEQVWWYTARASGITAWVLVTAAVLWGMALSTRALGRRPGAPWITDLHRFLGGAALTFTALHLVALWADSYVEFGPSELLVPLASAWQPAPVALGVVAFYLLVAVEVTSLLRRHLSASRWRTVHATSYALWALATVHLFTAGTDASHPALLGAAAASVAAVAFFTVYLAVGPGRAASVRAASRPGAGTGADGPTRSRSTPGATLGP